MKIMIQETCLDVTRIKNKIKRGVGWGWNETDFENKNARTTTLLQTH